MDTVHIFVVVVLVLVLALLGVAFFLFTSNKQFRIAEKCIELQGETIETKTRLVEEQAALISVLRSQTEYLQSEIMNVETETVNDLDNLIISAQASEMTMVSVAQLIALGQEIKSKAEKRKHRHV